MANLDFRLLVSACLLGQPVRYNGKSKPIAELEWLQELKNNGQLIVACPELLGGLTVPRAPAERVGDRVISVNGDDVTDEFLLGAQKTLTLCEAHQITHVLLKAKSPSCGNQEIYDGRFSGTLKKGKGVTAELLLSRNIEVYSELQLDALKVALTAATNR